MDFRKALFIACNVMLGKEEGITQFDKNLAVAEIAKNIQIVDRMVEEFNSRLAEHLSQSQGTYNA